MIRVVHLSFFAVAVVFGAAPALACIAPPQPSDKSVRIVGPDCSIEEHVKGEVGSFYADKALDHGDQIVSQVLTEAAGCYQDSLYVIADCGTQKVAIFAGEENLESGWYQEISDTEEYALSYSEYVKQYGKDLAFLLALHGEPVPTAITPDAGLAVAGRLKMAFRDTGSTSGSVRLGQFQANLGCGCKLYYPDKAGATQ